MAGVKLCGENMRKGRLLLVLCLFLSADALSEDGGIHVTGFECAKKDGNALEWLGLQADFPRNIVDDSKAELLNWHPDATIHAVNCKSEPFYVARPYFEGKRIVEGKTNEVSISFSLSMEVTMPPDKERTIHIDMTYTGAVKAETNIKTVERQFAIVGNVRTKSTTR